MSCPMEAHITVKASGCYNLESEKLLLQTQLNTSKWEENPYDYWDWQLAQFLKFGFPLDFKQILPLKCDLLDHKSAMLFPSHVDTYINKKNWALHGPFSVVHLSPEKSQIHKIEE